MLVEGMQNRDLVPPGLSSNFLPVSALLKSTTGAVPDASVPGRPRIWDMADSGQSGEQMLALKIMISVINYDLSSEPTHRRTSEQFDQDWQLFVDVAGKNGVRLLDGDFLREPLQVCSCREFDEGKADSDAFGEALGLWHWFARQGQALVLGANR
jgi:hypothetical protein